MRRTRNGEDDPGEDPYLRVGEVAALFHVSPKTVTRWADEGRLPHTVTLGGHRRFPSKAIADLLEAVEQR